LEQLWSSLGAALGRPGAALEQPWGNFGALEQPWSSLGAILEHPRNLGAAQQPLCSRMQPAGLLQWLGGGTVLEGLGTW